VDLESRLAAVLLGTAVGDALGLAAEGMKAAAIARRWGRLDRYRLLGRTGFVSDDTEQTALAAQALALHPHDPDRFVRAFRRSLVGWFWRLPWGVGMATIKACLKASIGLRSGVRSAGNGAAMRAAIVGAYFHDRPGERRRFGEALARVTHTDERAVQGALFVAELAAAGPEAARALVVEPSLAAALDASVELARRGASTAEAAGRLGTSGFVVHTVPFALFCHLRHGETALLEAVNAGGDTDTIGAIVGAWSPRVPGELIDALGDGPFGRTHLRGLARALACGEPPPAWSWVRAMVRNLALYPVVLAHGFRRLIPF
jgi:ADP-ribosyl-[dinitrogen reductase] hydrolase